MELMRLIDKHDREVNGSTLHSFNAELGCSMHQDIAHVG
jgi:hypothetical protein